MPTLIYMSTWGTVERWTKEGEREQGLRTEFVPCNHIHGPWEADRMIAMPVDKVGAQRIGRMN